MTTLHPPLKSALLAVAMLAPVPTAAAEAESEPAKSSYEFRAVRIEGAATAFIYRLHCATGEVCAFGFAQGTAGEPRGCAGGIQAASPSRFTLEAVQGARGTNQSSAYRLDRFTGEICRFRVPVTPDASLEAVGCVVKQPDAAAR